MLIRRATPEDADTLSALSIRTFEDTFGHLYPPEDLHAYLDWAYAVERQHEVLADPEQAVWLLERDGEAVGYVAAGPCGLPHADVRPGDGELKRLYVLQELHNGGWGRRLMQAAMDWLLRNGERPLWIGVWSENHGAQRFYARYGFQYAGAYEFPVGRVRDHELIFRREPGSVG